MDMKTRELPTVVDPDDLDDKNPVTEGEHFNTLVQARIQRRDVIRGVLGLAAMAGGAGALTFTAVGDAKAQPVIVNPRGRKQATQLDFDPIARSIADDMRVAAGYTATVIYATGDALTPAVPEYAGDGSEDRYDLRSGDHHDGMNYFGLHPQLDVRDTTSNTRAILAVNHENITGTAQFLHPLGETNNSASAGPRPESEVIKEQDAHGVSFVELRKVGGQWKTHKPSRYNRHITARTVVEIAGPARGTDYVKTKFSPSGLLTRGTLNNCGHGVTPWGTYLTCEENWAGYFKRNAGDDALRSQRENTQLLRNGIRPNSEGFAHRRWASVVPSDPASTDFARWNCSVIGATALEDFRNEHNTQGYIVEIDPYQPEARAKKRTAMGRRANEGAWCSLPKPGRPLAFYIGCDSRNEYVYKYVTTENWNPLDARRGGMAVGDKYLDRGTIYAAVFNADGTGRWEPLTLANPKVAAGVPVSANNPGGYQFQDLADICVNTRLAAGAAGATRMDRPEWTAVNPFNGEVYITMTENPDRGNTGNSNNNVPNPPLDAANPRYWRDTKGATSQGPAIANQRGNVNGHIVRIREDADDAGALTFRWDIFLFCAQANADTPEEEANYQQNVNLSGLTDNNDLSKPDGIWFSEVTGICYIQTDDNTFTDRCNAQLLACIPGRYGDGGPVDIVNLPSGSPNQAVTQPVTIRSYAGRRMTDATLKRLFVGPRGAEITGLTESPDGKALFINVQHPGENTGRAGAVPASVALTPATPNGPFESNWPGNMGYGPGGAGARPRSATVVITRVDGGVIGYDPGMRMGSRG
jgi:secreted PhoX family phosphatase